MPAQYATRLDDVDLHPAGWTALPSGVRITSMPLVDRALLEGRGFCRGSGVAVKWAKARGFRLPTANEYRALHALAARVHIDPFPLPTAAMSRAAGARTQAAIDAFRARNMSSRAWCELHDVEVYARLERAGWDGASAVDNAGKHIDRDGDIIGWKQKNGTFIQNESPAHRPPPGVSMESWPGQLDYATTVHVVDDGVPATPPDTSHPPPTKPGDRGAAVVKWQTFLIAFFAARGEAALPKFGADGIHGTATGETETWTKRWRALEGAPRAPRRKAPAKKKAAPKKKVLGKKRSGRTNRR